jgi:type IV secretory pathway VirB4 component
MLSLKRRQSEEKSIREILKPSSVEIAPDKITINKRQNRIIMAAGWPGRVQEGFLDRIITAKGEFDISLHIHPMTNDDSRVYLDNAIKKMDADNFSLKKTGSSSATLTNKINDANSTLKKVEFGEERLFDTSLYVNVKAYDDSGLEKQTKKIESIMSSVKIVPRRPGYRMREGIESVLPFARNMLGVKRALTTSALSALFPFTTSYLEIEDGGVLLGVNEKNSIPIIQDIFKFRNPNGIVVGSSGSGKSFAAKLLATRIMWNGAKVRIIDPEGEYAALASALGGKVVKISRDSKTCINILDFMGQGYNEKRESLMSSFAVLFGDMSSYQKSRLERAILATYKMKGIEKEDTESWKKTPPILSDLHKALSDEREIAETQKHKDEILSIMCKMDMFVEDDGLFSYLNSGTQMEFENQLVVFDISEMSEHIQPLILHMILEYLNYEMRRDRERSLVIVDEVWKLLREPAVVDHIFKMVKTSRKWNMSLFLITQQVRDLVNSEAGEAVLANTSFKYIFGHEASDMKYSQPFFGLNERETQILLTAKPGEGVLMLGDSHYNIKIEASPEETKIVTTDADVLRKEEID